MRRLITKTIISTSTVLALTLALTHSAQAQTYQVIHRFRSALGDGANPNAGLTIDAAGRLYGTTTYGYGTVFKLTHSGSGWLLTPIYNFANFSDGDGPKSRVIFGPDGSLYGTTVSGGNYGYGTVFNLQPPLSACKSALCPWRKVSVYSFAGKDGIQPQGDLAFDTAGNLYGATWKGGSYGAGVAYELSRAGSGWMETILYDFVWPLMNPAAGLTFDQDRNLYGTVIGGAGNYGAVYQLTPSGGGWTANTVYQFQGGADGAFPGGLISDSGGNFYGSTVSGGTGGGGTVFQLTPSGGGWTLSVLNSLVGACCNAGPRANLVMDKAGNLYGTTYSDGAHGLGSVFKLTPGPGGWTYTSLHDFSGDDGAYPISNVVFDASGNLYGTTSAGGSQYNCGGGCGVVWEITP